MRAAAAAYFLRCRHIVLRPCIVVGSNDPNNPLVLFSTNNTNIHHHHQSYPYLFFSSVSTSRTQNQNQNQTASAGNSKLLEQESESQSAAAGSESDIIDNAADVFRRWGCSEEQLCLIQQRRPALLRMNPSSLQSKLHILRRVRVLPPDLIRIVTCRPRFLFSRIGRGLEFLCTLFPCSDSDSVSDLLRKAVLRNPSLLNYKVEETMRPCVQLYERMGINRHDLGRLLISRPTIIPRSSLSDDKLELIRCIPLHPSSSMYKYAVSIVAISRIETIRSKIANLEKFGFSFDQVMALFARSPNVLTLSIDKVQRNMTYILGIVKLSPSAVLHDPFLLYANLDTVLKPRYLVGLKLQEMGLHPQITDPGTSIVKALRMKESRFMKAFIMCHKDKDVVESLMELYTSVKGSSRLAQSCRKVVHKGFPF